VVEHHVANVMVVGSSPITRSSFKAAAKTRPLEFNREGCVGPSRCFAVFRG
jgi:hypothetical protein